MKTETKRTAILGSGNIGMSLAKGLIKADYCKPEDITLTRRSVQRLDDVAAQGFQVSSDNYAAAAGASGVVTAGAGMAAGTGAVTVSA